MDSNSSDPVTANHLSMQRQRQYHEEDVHEALHDIHVFSADVVNRHNIAEESHYLQVVICELRDQAQLHRIFGIVVDVSTVALC